MSAPIQSVISRLLSSSNLTPRHLRKFAIPLDRLVAPEAAHERRKPSRGAPHVAPPPEYHGKAALAHAVARAPGTLAANVYILSEVRRCLGEGFRPQSVLDFGAGVGIGTMAAARVFNEDPFEKVGAYLRKLGTDGDGGEEDREGSMHVGQSFIREAVLVDHSSAMREMAGEVLSADGLIGGRLRLSHCESLRDAPRSEGGYDVVVASYSLNEVVREAMVDPAKTGETSETGEVGEQVARDDRVRIAEKRLRRKVKELWARTSEGGVLVVVEDGTAAGFETIVFARDVVLKLAERANEGAEKGNEEDAEQKTESSSGACVIAPCMHSKACPLDGSITPHRVCRFQQRFNRPLFLRRYRPLHTGYEDEYFSYIVIQKTSRQNREGGGPDEVEGSDPWGRLVREPLMKGKHVVMDACTIEGKLERRTFSKKTAPPGQYSRARRSKWGDIWPIKPTSKPQPVNF